jgi:hypothetical protein
MQGIPFGIICAILSVLVGAQEVDQSWIAREFAPVWYHVVNALMGYVFGVSVVTFFRNLEKVLAITEAFAKWFVAAAMSLVISAAYLVLQFYRIFA